MKPLYQLYNIAGNGKFELAAPLLEGGLGLAIPAV